MLAVGELAVGELAAGVLAVAVLAGCGAGFPRQEARGATTTCPDVRIAVGPGEVSPDAVRCSYSDTLSDRATLLSGSVMGEAAESAFGTPLTEMYVAIHRVDAPAAEWDLRRPGEAVAAVNSDAQGRFEFEVALEGGEYLLVVREDEGGEVLAHMRVDVQGGRGQTYAGLRLIVPRGVFAGDGDGERRGEASDAEAASTRPERAPLPPATTQPWLPHQDAAADKETGTSR